MNLKKYVSAITAILLVLASPAAATPVVLEGTFTIPGGLPPSGGGFVSSRLAMYKAAPMVPAFQKVGAGVVMRAGVGVEMPGVFCAPTVEQNVALPALAVGTDYRIVIDADCNLAALAYATAVPLGAQIIGGFHYLPGGYPAGFDQAGNWAPTVLEWSFWDMNFRPACDPRGMTRVGNSGVWVDIYFQGNSSNLDGVSRNNDPILTGGNPPLVPADYGGNGTTKFSTMNWWEANEHLRQWGKRLPSYEEMVLAGFGVNEGDGRGNHPVKTGLATANNGSSASDPNFTSKWGLIQATGVIWIWTSTLSDWQGTATTNAHGWEAYDVTGGRGKIIMQNNADLTALLYGGSSVYTTVGSPTGVTHVAGSRTTETIEKLWDNSVNIAIRGACDHMWR